MARDTLEQRRDKILALVSDAGELSASELSDQLGVSVQTIRTDLRDLDAAAMVQRKNGAVRLRQLENIAYAPRRDASTAEKQRIASAVAALIEQGARIALGTGTTVEHCAHALSAQNNLFVATNSIHAVMALQNAPGAVVEMAGGTVRLRDLDVIGPTSRDFFSRFRMDHAIFSCGGVSSSGEVLDYNSDEIAARMSVADCAKQKILVVDSAKFDRDLPCVMHQIWDYDVVVTGADLSADIIRKCAAANCQIIKPDTQDGN
ncbi:transcriptional regulator, DeoR family [Aliiroseovarius halocynthiae]|uniref:DeoR/GlpR transcriptional regulator n=1 Tax=Aliiroseovarius halocynthiae TaxID=985055 RepID=A0A545SS81_9RHOB|nr:DeoR/GlpR family DNA-binding transcription regulator [Aliiroseovarius halocynthiae]TQV67828.1 DeoR/GlpR transcriptional regulator [Aliiroseovarius halocynthiae]SMR72919.1 transcriptional regulator, DeoR family [Aliiroseovarius halocynthiae]